MLIVDNSVSYPTPVTLYSPTFYNGSFTINWSQNNDNDFSYYRLYEVQSSNTQSLIYETENVS